ncbi:hypothetical protein NLU13_8180 [Sarocladium strictum]|uniref:SGNH hydrolase-type esterase domain-containing protein n=1 Tax=Sarocladium strictum TaxID=5046 RepID=A0AA39L4E2_SARSR|nr:hypothetical protein NLU13_8180 [Sarocladium strictum]
MRCVSAVFAVALPVLSQTWDGPRPYKTELAPDVIAGDNWDAPHPAFEGLDGNLTTDEGADHASDRFRSRALDFYLRIMPLGASITQGVGSSDQTGYRKVLRQKLRFEGFKVNMVGSKQNGNMADSDNEGHPGWTVEQVHGEWRKDNSKGLKPNLVLINAGTYVVHSGVDENLAGQRMENMIRDVYNDSPGVTVILSTLVPLRDRRECTQKVSDMYTKLVTETFAGQRIGLADIHPEISSNEMDRDGIHPNDEGFRVFAAVWWDAIRKLEGVIQPPRIDGLIKDDEDNQNNNCPKVAGNAPGPVKTQQGSGADDGNYVHNRIERGAIESARIQKAGDPQSITSKIPSNIFFANIVKNDPNADRALALDDWIRIFTDTAGSATYYFRQNLGGGRFGPSTTFDPGLNCPESSSRRAWGDFNNDGLDDFFCIGSGAAVSVSLNRGGSPPRFESIGVVVPASAANADQVRIADIDGDGRADFCVVETGAARCSRNGGKGDDHFWQGFITEGGRRDLVFNARSAPIDSWVFGDMNGDFRSDILFVGDNGNVETWINRRRRGAGIVPGWASSGITHAGQGDSGIRGNIKFGKIYGSNRLDYIYLKEERDWFDVRVWENTGQGGTKQKGDGVFYCDMRGTGTDDYVWIYMDGHADEIFINIKSPPNWGHDHSISLRVPGPRTGIHLADWNGNGRCDVLVQDKASGALTLYENQYNAATKSISFANRGVVYRPNCPEGWGPGIFDRGMRLADIDGDRRADIICLEKDGRLTGWLNEQGGVRSVGQIKFDEGWTLTCIRDRANVRLADVENSGRADIIWLNKYTGAASVWKNNGSPAGGGGGGSSFSWTKRGVLYSPIDRGEVMNFANLGGLGRADLIQVYPDTNEAYTYFNQCGGGRGGDDGPITDPVLPPYPRGTRSS